VNAHVAQGAFLVFGIEHVVRTALHKDPGVLPSKRTGPVMTFETNGEHDRPPQQFRIGGPVRGMAGDTAFHPDNRVLEHERPALIHVTLQAGHFVVVRRSQHGSAGSGPESRRDRAVRIMAIRALHRALIHTMFHRHIELRPDRGMAGIAKLRLLFGQQELRRLGLVDGVAIRADHIGFGMG